MKRLLVFTTFCFASLNAAYVRAEFKIDMISCRSQSDAGRMSTVIYHVTVPDWHQLATQATKQALFDAATQQVYGVCGITNEDQQISGVFAVLHAANALTVSGARQDLDQWEKRGANYGVWRTYGSALAALFYREKVEIERAKRQAEEKQALQRQAEENEQRRRVAIAECGSAPKMSGGPWFSSTYSVAAIDETKRGYFFCVKSIEYLSAAPNPFGGNAARAQFSGYRNGDFQPVVTVRDFPY